MPIEGSHIDAILHTITRHSGPRWSALHAVLARVVAATPINHTEILFRFMRTSALVANYRIDASLVIRLADLVRLTDRAAIRLG